jgi:hypothetical protein
MANYILNKVNRGVPKSRTREYQNDIAKKYYHEHKDQIAMERKINQYSDLGIEYVKQIFAKYDDKMAKRILRMKRGVLELQKIELN